MRSSVGTGYESSGGCRGQQITCVCDFGVGGHNFVVVRLVDERITV